MTHLPSLPADARLLDVFRAYPAPAGPLLDYHEVVMRGESPLSQAERELIAAYVSGLNACDYCFGVHRTTAQAFGVEEGLLTSLLADIETADIDERMRPLLWYVGKVTKEPGRVSPADAQRVLDAGWDEQALHDAVSVCALFNFMNRFVSGLGSPPERTTSRCPDTASQTTGTRASRSCCEGRPASTVQPTRWTCRGATVSPR